MVRHLAPRHEPRPSLPHSRSTELFLTIITGPPPPPRRPPTRRRAASAPSTRRSSSTSTRCARPRSAGPSRSSRRTRSTCSPTSSRPRARTRPRRTRRGPTSASPTRTRSTTAGACARGCGGGEWAGSGREGRALAAHIASSRVRVVDAREAFPLCAQRLRLRDGFAREGSVRLVHRVVSPPRGCTGGKRRSARRVVSLARFRRTRVPSHRIRGAHHHQQTSRRALTRCLFPFPRQSINEYQVCVYQRGAQDPACLQRGRDYATICPQKWIEDWKSQAEEGCVIGMRACAPRPSPRSRLTRSPFPRA